MKFDPLNWNEVKPNEEIHAEKGWLRLRASCAAPLYLESYGVEALVGVQTAFEVEISEAVRFRVDAPPGTRVFIEVRETTSFEQEGEVFTNIDRMPDESGSVAEVTRAMRQFQLEQRAVLREMRAERDELQAQKRVKRAEPAAAEKAVVSEQVIE